MSDKLYAVEFRSMHTAIHNIAVFSLESVAAEFFNFINYAENLPSEIEFEFDPRNFVGIYEINFRRKSHEVGGVPIIYVNDVDNREPYNTVPDVYNY